MSQKRNGARYELIISLIGAFTGIIALSWQIWDSVKPVEDKIIADYEIKYGPGDYYQVSASVTNIGADDVYISTAEIDFFNKNADNSSSGFVFPVHPIINNQLLKPGQNKRIVLLIFDSADYFEYLFKFEKFSQIKIITTRNKEIVLDDLYYQLFQFIYTIDADIPYDFQPCSCTSDIDCGDFDSQEQAQSCFWYCYSQGLGDFHKLDVDNDGRACTEIR